MFFCWKVLNEVWQLQVPYYKIILLERITITLCAVIKKVVSYARTLRFKSELHQSKALS